jgi:hypothetical protein
MQSKRTDGTKDGARVLANAFFKASTSALLRFAEIPSGLQLHIGASVHRFPYVVFYKFDNDMVTVCSIFHSSQNPKKLRQRLR